MSIASAASTVLVIAAHPDDEILGGGATFAKLARRGRAVHALIVCEGESVRYGEGGEQQQQSQRAAELIGFASLRCLGLPDQRLDTISQIDLNQQLEAILDELRPSTVYTHCAGDINRDHQILHEAVLVATRPGRTYIEEVLGFETPSATGLEPEQAFRPDTFEVVTDTLSQKLAAMRCYETEAPPFPHPRSLQALRHRAHYWGSRIHRDAAEPFVTLRRIKG